MKKIASPSIPGIVFNATLSADTVSLMFFFVHLSVVMSFPFLMFCLRRFCMKSKRNSLLTLLTLTKQNSQQIDRKYPFNLKRQEKQLQDIIFWSMEFIHVIENWGRQGPGDSARQHRVGHSLLGQSIHLFLNILIYIHTYIDTYIHT